MKSCDIDGVTATMTEEKMKNKLLEYDWLFEKYTNWKSRVGTMGTISYFAYIWSDETYLTFDSSGHIVFIPKRMPQSQLLLQKILMKHTHIF